MQKQPLENISSSAILYLLCEKLPLDIYEDCLIDNDLHGLVISGTASEEQLKETWDNIYTQSLQLAQNNTYNEAFEILKDIDDCKAKLTIVNNTVLHFSCCNQQGIDLDIELIAVLNSMALRTGLKPEDRGEGLIKKLNMVVARAKKWVEKIEGLRKTLEGIRENNMSDGKTDRQYFDGWLDAISSDKGFFIKASEITVSRFYRSIELLKEKARKLEIEKQRRLYA
jgi:hypothetical protein